MSEFSFSKYSGCGNDFILIDNRKNIFPKENKDLIKSLCRRSLGIGADGLILLEDSAQASYKMIIFNSDGGEAEMCGNGLRCLGMFINELGIAEPQFEVEVTKKNYTLSLGNDRVSIEMPPSAEVEWDLTIPYSNTEIKVDYLDTGVPHVVSFIDDIESIDLKKIGPELRYHPRFGPRGTNVNFATATSKNYFTIRTHERGVEGETLACGTGAAAVAVAAEKRFALTGPITIKTRSGEQLVFNIFKDGNDIKKIVMEGPAIKIYSGSFISKVFQKLLKPMLDCGLPYC